MIHVAAERGIVGKPHGEFDRRDERGGGNVAEGIGRQAGHVHHEGDASARPDIGGSAAAGHPRQRILHRARQAHGIFGHARAQRAARAAHEKHGAQSRFAIFLNAVDGKAQGLRQLAFNGAQPFVEPIETVMLAGGRDHEQGEPRLCVFRIEGAKDRKRIGDIRPAPARAGLGDLKIAAGRRAPALHLDAGRRNVEHLARLMLRENAGDVIVDDDDLVDVPQPLLGEHADRRRSAANPHPLFSKPVDDRRRAGLDDDGLAAVDRELDRLSVRQVEQRVAGDAAFLLRASGQMMHAAERQHLRSVFARRHMADRFAFRAHRRLFGAEVAVGVDLRLDAAIAEDALGHDGDHVDPVHLRGNDERRGLIVGVGRARPDRGHEDGLVGKNVARPFGLLAREREGNDAAAAFDRALEQDMGIDAHELAVAVGVAVAGASHAEADVTGDRTGVAADLVGAFRLEWRLLHQSHLAG